MNNIRNIRKKAGLSLAELHRQMGIPKRTLEDWDSQKATPTVYHRIKKLSEILNCSMDDIMEFQTNVIYHGKNASLIMHDVEEGVFVIILDENNFEEQYRCTISQEIAFDLYQRNKDKDVWDLSCDTIFE